MKKRILTETEKKGVLAIITVGCSRETAAKYARCSTKKLRDEIAADPKFATEIKRAEEDSEIFFVNKIRKAADKEQYWRAAAWALERRCPNRYAPRGAKTLTLDDAKQIVAKLADIVIQEVPTGAERRRILKRIHELVKEHDDETTDTPLTPLETEDE